MKSLLPVFIMVDACGWEIVKNDPFCKTFAPVRKRLNSVFGYSSACVPSILSGRWPDEHRNWCYFVHDPARSPFRALKPLQWLPKALTSRRFVRRWLTKLVRKKLRFEGYFDLYNIPFEHITLYDFTEKKSPLKPGGMNAGSNIFDFLQERNIPYFVSEPEQSEEANRAGLLQAIGAGKIDFAFCYWPGLDGLLHRVGNQSPEIRTKLREYERWITGVIEAAQSQYQEIALYVFSDHGMANCEQHLDLKRGIESLGLQFGRDYSVVYDSTMARFWFFNDQARNQVTQYLQTVSEGRILDDLELQELRAYFPDRSFGELFFLVREGVLIVPSHMGERPITAMHGYHPSEKHSYAMICTNQPAIPDGVAAIPDIYALMTSAAEQAHQLNSTRPAAHFKPETVPVL